MISLENYFGPWLFHKDATEARRASAEKFLLAVNSLKALAEEDGVLFQMNPKTGSCVSGALYGGFRPQDCPQGAPGSSHKEGRGLDLYDPLDHIDNWCQENQHKLESCGIYIEHPETTRTWSHWTDRAPKSGNRMFYP